MQKPKLIHEFYKADKENVDFLVLIVDHKDNDEYEYIFVPKENFDNKKRYIYKAYSYDLVHKSADKISIVDVVAFNSKKLRKEILPNKKG